MANSSEAASRTPGDIGNNPIEILQRWEAFGALWKVVSNSGETVTISMCRCDGGEEVQRLSSADSKLLAWLAERESPELPPDLSSPHDTP